MLDKELTTILWIREQSEEDLLSLLDIGVDLIPENSHLMISHRKTWRVPLAAINNGEITPYGKRWIEKFKTEFLFQ